MTDRDDYEWGIEMLALAARSFDRSGHSRAYLATLEAKRIACEPDPEPSAEQFATDDCMLPRTIGYRMPVSRATMLVGLMSIALWLAILIWII